MASEVIPKYPPLHAPYCRGGSCHAAGGQPRSCGPHAARSRAHGVARRRSPAAPLWTSILQRFCTCKIGYRSYDEAFRPFSSIILFVLLCYFEPSEVILSLSLSLSLSREESACVITIVSNPCSPSICAEHAFPYRTPQYNY